MELVPWVLGDATSASENAGNGKEWVMNLYLSWNFGIGGTYFSFIFSSCIDWEYQPFVHATTIFGSTGCVCKIFYLEGSFPKDESCLESQLC